MRYAWLALGLICLAAFSAQAAEIAARTMDCARTPALAAPGYPGENAVTTNSNLAIPPGKSEAPAGQMIMFSGRVVDTHCVPVVGAAVELWQADPFGKTAYPDAASLTGPEPMFAGAGRAYTNNQGRFTFISLFPGSKGGAAPKLNVRIGHPSLKGDFTTSLYFSGERRNAADPALKRLSAPQREEVMLQVSPSGNILVVTRDIVVSGNDARKGF